MSVKNIKANRVELDLGGVKYKLSFDMGMGMELAEKYGSVKEAFEVFDSVIKDQFSLTKIQLELISDLIYLFTGSVIEDRAGILKLLNMKNLAGILLTIGQAITGNLPEAEEGSGPPQKP